MNLKGVEMKEVANMIFLPRAFEDLGIWAPRAEGLQVIAESSQANEGRFVKVVKVLQSGEVLAMLQQVVGSRWMNLAGATSFEVQAPAD